MRKLFLILILLDFFAVAHASENSRINVSGQCIRTLVPDRASVNISSEVLEKTVGEASAKANDFYNKMREAVKKLNLKDLELETTQYNLYEKTEWQNNKTVSKGFRAAIGLSVSTSETGRIGEVISAATKFPAARVGGLSNFVSIEKMNQEKEACLESAVKNARAKAEKVARAANVSIGGLENFIEESSYMPMPMPMARASFGKMAEADMAGGAPPQIEAGTQKLNVTIQAAFSIK